MAELIDELARIKATKPAREVVVLTQETFVIEREINEKMKGVILKQRADEINSESAAKKIYLMGGEICC